MSAPSQISGDRLAGTARLPVVVLVSLGSFFFSSILEYCLPLYFSVLPGFPAGMWADLVAWQVAPWCVGPFLAGMLARRVGERRVWAVALLGQSLVPMALVAFPRPEIVAPMAFWNGMMGALMWVGGASLAQIVPAERKGLSNGLFMMSLGAGSLLGPLAGRAILWHEMVQDLSTKGAWSDVGKFLVSIIKPDTQPSLDSFRMILMGLAGMTALGCGLMWAFGQRQGRWQGDELHQSWGKTITDLKRLLAEPRFWALVVALCLFGGPVFQATNQYLFYRARDLGLIVGGQDHGWINLQLLQKVLWIPGGLAVGLLAGRRAPGLAAVCMLGAFAAAGAAIGVAPTVWALFAAVATFEFVRQFMRWSHAGYLSEHLPAELRATAIGGAITVAGLSSTIFAFAAKRLFDADATGFDSRAPFWLAAGLGLAGALGLLIFDRFVPIRQPAVPHRAGRGEA